MVLEDLKVLGLDVVAEFDEEITDGDVDDSEDVGEEEDAGDDE